MEVKGKTGRKWGDNQDGCLSPPPGLRTLTYSFASHFPPTAPSEPPNGFVKRRRETWKNDKGLLSFEKILDPILLRFMVVLSQLRSRF